MGVVGRLFGQKRDWYRHSRKGSVWHLSRLFSYRGKELLEQRCSPQSLSGKKVEHVWAVMPKGKVCRECQYREGLAQRPTPTPHQPRVQDEEAEWAAGRIPKRYLLDKR